ncbi:hypothetical protein HCU74_00650 [Spongiibacter sp. KMU-166]|uniref:Uncharacterized protein n=1 Tax=Spongiibacter thalassae TaxID=2721624 RepID=A0ABX1G9T0_9GAMM|nr:hypothetical protein [Spongiibacter thalassae]NKI15914.1 hypothetical protein [Spongiibacter thalassae]
MMDSASGDIESALPLPTVSIAKDAYAVGYAAGIWADEHTLGMVHRVWSVGAQQRRGLPRRVLAFPIHSVFFLLTLITNLTSNTSSFTYILFNTYLISLIPPNIFPEETPHPQRDVRTKK